MNTKAMEAAKAVKALVYEYNGGVPVGVCLESLAEEISKFFPEPSVPVSVPEGWMRDINKVKELADHLKSIAWRPDASGDPECFDQGAAMSLDVIRLLLIPMLEARAQEQP
ncbi:MAG: hypothetical protein KGL39_13990 [Patescibacteria group bacterium]|nr:hypothetical protein [Patescibacteria group bacterium]